MHPDLVLLNGRFTTNDPAQPAPEAVAITNGVFAAVGQAEDVMARRGPSTRVVDLGGRRAIPGLIDSHIHLIRGGLNYNMELRWDGVASPSDAMAMLRAQVEVTPPPQWVRVVGGFVEMQFAEKRLPTLDELNAVAPDTPVFILHLHDRALLNRAALRAVGYTRDTPAPPGGEIVRDGAGEPTGPPAPPVLPDWSPVKRFGGYPSRRLGQPGDTRMKTRCACAAGCAVHGHDHAAALRRGAPAADARGFWGAFLARWRERPAR